MRKKVPVFHTEIKTKNMVLKKKILLNQKLYILDYIFIHRLIDIQKKTDYVHNIVSSKKYIKH